MNPETQTPKPLPANLLNMLFALSTAPMGAPSRGTAKALEAGDAGSPIWRTYVEEMAIERYQNLLAQVPDDPWDSFISTLETATAHALAKCMMEVMLDAFRRNVGGFADPNVTPNANSEPC
jgi:hypothetical protein